MTRFRGLPAAARPASSTGSRRSIVVPAGRVRAMAEDARSGDGDAGSEEMRGQRGRGVRGDAGSEGMRGQSKETGSLPREKDARSGDGR